MIEVKMSFASIADMCRALGPRGAEEAIRQDPASIDNMAGEAALAAIGVETVTRAAVPAPAGEPAPESAEKPKRGRKPKAKAEPTPAPESAPAPVAPEEPEPAPVAVPEAPMVINHDNVLRMGKALAMKVGGAEGVGLVEAIVNKHGATKIKELAPDRLEACLRELTEASKAHGVENV